MPRYLVQDPDSGRSMLLEGDSAPTEQELNEIFKAYSTTPDAAPAPAQEPATTEAPAAKPEPEKPSPTPLVSNPEMQEKLGLRPIDISQRGPRRSYAENALTPEERQEAVRRETWDKMSLADRASQSIARGAQAVGRAAGGMVRGLGTVIDKGAESALAQEGFLDEAAQLRQRTGDQKLADREKMPLVQAGRAIDTATAKAFPYEKPEKATDIAGATLEAVGTIVPPLLLAPVGGTAGALAAGTLMEFDDAYEREIQGQQQHKEEVDTDLAFRNAAKYAGLTVPIELSLGIGRILGNIKKYFGADAALEAGKKAVGGVPALAEFTRERMKDAGAGFVQEFAEATAQNLIIDGQPQLANAFKEGVMGLVGQTVVGGATQGTAMAAQAANERSEIRQGEKQKDRMLNSEPVSAYRDRLAQIGADPVVQQVAPLTAAVLTDQAQVTPPNEGKEMPVDQPETTEQRLTREAQPAIESFNAAKKAEERANQTVTSDEPIRNLVGRMANWNGQVGFVALDEAGRPVLESDGRLVELPANADTSASELGIEIYRRARRQSAEQEAPTEDRAEQQRRATLKRDLGELDAAVQDVRRRIIDRDVSDAVAAIKERKASRFEPNPTSMQLINAVLNVAQSSRPSLQKRYGALEAAPTAKNIINGTIARLEAEQRHQEAEQWYKALVAIEEFENKYLDAVTQPGKSQPKGGVEQSEEEGQKEGVQVTPTEPTGAAEQAAPEGTTAAPTEPTQPESNVPPTSDTSAPQEPVAETVQPNAPEQAGSQNKETAKANYPVIPEGSNQPTKKASHTDKSVRDHSQQATVSGDTITIVSRVGNQRTGSYTIPLAEWQATERGPSANPNYNKFELIQKYTSELDDQPGGPDQAQRIRDSQVIAITKAIAKRTPASTKPPTPNVTPTVTPERVPPTSGEPATQTTAQKEVETPKEKVTASNASMGNAVGGEFAPQAKFTASMKAEAIEEDRKRKNLPPLTKAERVGNEEVWRQAMAIIDDDWTAPEKLLKDLQENPRVLNPVERMLLLYLRANLENSFDRAVAEVTQLTKDGKLEMAAAAAKTRNDLLGQINDLQVAAGIGERGAATMAGRALQALQYEMNEDYSLASRIIQREHTLNRKLTEDEIEKMRKENHELNLLNKEIEHLLEIHEQRVRDNQFEAAFQHAVREVKNEPPPQKRYSKRVLEMAEAYSKRCAARADKAMADIKAMLKGEDPNQPLFAGPPINPELLDKFIVYAANRMMQYGVDLAVWTEEMVAVAGERFRQYAEEIWEAAKQRVNQDDFDKEMGGDPVARRQAKDVAKTGKTLTPEQRKKRILSKFKTKEELESMSSEERIEFVRSATKKIGRFILETEGITKNRDEFADKIFAVLGPEIPNLTRNEVIEAFCDYGKYTEPSQDVTDVKLREYRSQFQQVLKLQDLAEGRDPLATGRGRGDLDSETRRLVKQVEQAKRDKQRKEDIANAEREKAGLPPLKDQSEANRKKLRTAIEAAERRIDNQIADLQYEIDNEILIVRSKNKLDYPESLLKKIAHRDALKEIKEEVFKKPPPTEAELLEKWKTFLKKQYVRIKEKVGNRDFKRHKKPQPPPMDKEALDLLFERDQMHKVFLQQRINDELSHRGELRKTWDTLVDMLRLVRLLTTTGEFSGILKQGLITLATRPQLNLTAIPKGVKAMWSDRNQFELNREIHLMPEYQESVYHGLDMPELGGRMVTQEEELSTNFLRGLMTIAPIDPEVHGILRAWGYTKIGAKYAVKGAVHLTMPFSRFMTTYLNYISILSFRNMKRAWGDSPQMLTAYANLINVARGRGSKSIAKASGTALNGIFFSPRFSISRFQYLLFQPFLHAQGLKGKAFIASEYLRFYAGFFTLITLGAMALGFEPPDEWDIRSPKALKPHKGDRYYDFSGGMLPTARFFATMLTGWRKDAKGHMYAIRNKYRFLGPPGASRMKAPYGKGMGWVMMNFIRSKLSPALGNFWSGVEGTDPTGEPFSETDAVTHSFSPITWWDIAKLAKEANLDEAVIGSVTAALGAGIQLYDERRKRRQRPEHPSR